MHTIKRFIDYYAPYKAVFFIDLICAAAISIIDLAYPQILRTMTNTLFTRDSQAILSALPLIAAGLFVMYIVQSLCKYYVSYQGHMMGANMERDMRQQLFDHYEKLSFSYYSRNNSGQMMSKLVSDLFDIAEFAHHGPDPVPDQLASRPAAGRTGPVHVLLHGPPEHPDAGDIYGKPAQDRRCELQPPGHPGRHPRCPVFRK